jgi:4-diphosphocytidyl-2-C-methyl-D-erythritol kinase
MRIGELARAKVNLTLVVRGRRTDGYHELESLVTFAEASDVVTIETDAAAGRLTVSGPSAPDIHGENLLGRTMALLRDADPHLRIGAVHLHKNLPVAAGLGGGSADAAALLRAVRRANPERTVAFDWLDIAARLGADVPVCFHGGPALMWGKGERIAPLQSLPALDAVLVNPRRPLPTGSVFAGLGRSAADADAPAPTPPAFADLPGLLDYMRAHGNDLEAPACALLPAIGEIRALLAAQPDCRFAAMSGSGPTCFGLFSSRDAARGAAAAIAAAKPAWWVKPTVLAGAS